MKKHVFGLLIFGFIVSAAAIVYAVFNVPSFTTVSITQYDPIQQPTSCWKMKRESKKSDTKSLTITQAVFNVKTKNLSWELDSARTNDFPVVHFFVKDEKGVRLLESIHSVKYFIDADAKKFSYQYLDLKKVSSQTSLYLIPDLTASSANDETERQNVIFDSNEAVSVTIDYGN